MPWFPEFASAMELARQQTRAAGQADPVGQYFDALNRGDIHDLETAWPGELVVHDPRAGEVRGHRQLRRVVRTNQSWLAEHGARIEPGAATGGRGPGPAPAGAGWWSCWRSWAARAGNWRARWRWLPSPPTTRRWCSGPTAA